MALTLFVPDLLLSADAPASMRGLRLPALERWLARADARRVPGGAAAWLLAEWALPPHTPVAPITLAADGGPREGEWLRADPVHQRVERNAIALHDAAVLDLTRGEADEAVAALNGFFGADGLAFEAHATERWYVRVPGGEMPTAVALDEATGRNPFGMLPSGGSRIRWRSVFSEAQMLLSALPLNAAREAQGRPQLNGLWFWGGGLSIESPRPPFAFVASSEPVSRGLAVASGLAPREVPSRLEALEGPGPGLVVLDSLRRPLRRGDEAAWREAARSLDEKWFAALGNALGTFGALRVVLPAEHHCAVFDLSRSMRWRLLRRAIPVSAHA
jgi:hypothetical protein